MRCVLEHCTSHAQIQPCSCSIKCFSYYYCYYDVIIFLVIVMIIIMMVQHQAWNMSNLHKVRSTQPYMGVCGSIINIQRCLEVLFSSCVYSHSQSCSLPACFTAIQFDVKACFTLAGAAGAHHGPAERGKWTGRSRRGPCRYQGRAVGC